MSTKPKGKLPDYHDVEGGKRKDNGDRGFRGAIEHGTDTRSREKEREARGLDKTD